MTPHPLLLFVLGTVLRVAGAEFLVRGASRLAVAAWISPERSRRRAWWSTSVLMWRKKTAESGSMRS
jgi:hypothetical protein